MIMRKFTIILMLCVASMSAFGQEATTTTSMGQVSMFTPKDKWELGVDLGSSFVIGDLYAKPGLGLGLHLRRALDHIFSLRGTVNYSKTKNEINNAADQRKSDMSWMSGSLQTVITLNNLRFNKPYRKVLAHVFLGAGIQKLKTNYENIPVYGNGTFDNEVNAQFEGGAGISFRVNKRFNVSFEHTAFVAFGKGADRLDGDPSELIGQTTYRDILHFPHVSLNFNLGKSDKSEPLYWVNAMGGFSDAIARLEARPVYDPTDTDGDGVIDVVDQEKDSPMGAKVDTRGVTLDSDGDKIADYKDKEPFSPPGYSIDAMGVAQVPKDPKLTEADVNRIVDAKLSNFKLPSQKGLVDWFLPMIHFDLDRYNIKKSEYEKLFHVATVLKQNPELRVAVYGHTDRSASNRYNNVLSYNRAKSAIDFLVSQHGISRDRLVLTWGGEETNLVPTNSVNYLNRRVEFKVATNETEMGRPEGGNAGRGGNNFNGNKDAGY